MGNKKIPRVLILWFILGMMYYTIEGFWRIKSGGWANISMLFVGGLCGAAVGYINQIPKFYNMKIWKQCLIGTAITLIVEFISGFILNIVLGLHIWDYSGRAFNIMGQVCLLYGILWFLLMPLAIWMEDHLRYTLFREGEFYTLKSIYVDLFTLK